MHPRRHRGSIRPKVSTMPRPQSEAAQYLDIYKLTVEKKRLAQELEGIDQRRQQIHDRIATLEAMVKTLEGKAHVLREADRQPKSTSDTPIAADPDNTVTATFETMQLDY